VEDARLAPVAVDIAEKQLELNAGRRLYYVVAGLALLMLAVTVYQADWLWVAVCVLILGFFGWWLAVGQARRSATLQRAIDANRELMRKKPAKARRKR
jgi:hypothetical protein